jgi:hypothetical protein
MLSCSGAYTNFRECFSFNQQYQQWGEMPPIAMNYFDSSPGKLPHAHGRVNLQ